MTSSVITVPCQRGPRSSRGRRLRRRPGCPLRGEELESPAKASWCSRASGTWSGAKGGIRRDRLRLPAESREGVLGRADAALVFAQPRGARTEAVVARAAKLSRVAAAMLARAGLGPLRHAVIEGAAETTYLRADDAALLT